MNPSQSTGDNPTLIIPIPSTSLLLPTTLCDKTSPTTHNINTTLQLFESQKKEEEESPSKIDSPPITAQNNMATTSSTTLKPTPSKSIILSSPEHSEGQKKFNCQLHEEQQLDQTQSLVLEGRDSELRDSVLRDQILQDEEDQEGSQSDDSMERLMRNDYRPSSALHTGSLDGNYHRETEEMEPPVQAEQDKHKSSRARVGITIGPLTSTPTINQTKWTIESTKERLTVLEEASHQTSQDVQQILKLMTQMN